MPRKAHRTVAVDFGTTLKNARAVVVLPWYVIAGLGPIAVLAGGWLVVAAFATLGWLTSPHLEWAKALTLAGQFVVLAHGGPVTIGGQLISLIPLGLTAGFLFLALPVARVAAHRAVAQLEEHGEFDPEQNEEVLFRTAGTFAASYAIVIFAMALTIGAASFQALFGGLIVGGIAGLWAGCRALSFNPTRDWPHWLQAVPRAVVASMLTLVAVSSLALIWAVWNGRTAIAAIVGDLGGQWPALMLLIVLHLSYLPNFVLACSSWILGAGVSLGDGSLLTMRYTDVGILPSIPILGAVPEPGAVPSQALWWLAIAGLAGVVAALIVALARPRARFDETAVVGALAGVLAGLMLALLCSIASGSLGAGRLQSVGAKMPELVIFAPTVLGLAGMVTGLVAGIIRRPERSTSTTESEALDSAE